MAEMPLSFQGRKTALAERGRLSCKVGSFLIIRPRECMAWRSSIQSTKTRPGADCGLDNELPIANFRLKLKKVGKTTRPFRYGLNSGSDAGCFDFTLVKVSNAKNIYIYFVYLVYIYK